MTNNTGTNVHGVAFKMPSQMTSGATSADELRSFGRIWDAVEAALSDVILLGIEEHVRLAAKAAEELAGGRPVHTAELVISLRNFIRQVLDLDPVPKELSIPKQGPARPSGGGRGKDGGGQGGGKSGGGKGGGAQAGGGGMGMAIDQDPDH